MNLDLTLEALEALEALTPCSLLAYWLDSRVLNAMADNVFNMRIIK